MYTASEIAFLWTIRILRGLFQQQLHYITNQGRRGLGTTVYVLARQVHNYGTHPESTSVAIEIFICIVQCAIAIIVSMSNKDEIDQNESVVYLLKLKKLKVITWYSLPIQSKCHFSGSLQLQLSCTQPWVWAVIQHLLPSLCVMPVPILYLGTLRLWPDSYLAQVYCQQRL